MANKPPKKRKRMTAKKKFEIYLRTRGDEAAVGEILREYGLHLSDLREIEETVESWAIHGLKQKKTPKASDGVSKDDLKALRAELDTKDKTIADLTVEYIALKKKDDLG